MSGKKVLKPWSAIAIAIFLAGTGMSSATAQSQSKPLNFDLSATVAPTPFRAWAENANPTAEFDSNGFPVFNNLVVKFEGVTTDIKISTNKNFQTMEDAKTNNKIIFTVFSSKSIRLLEGIPAVVEATEEAQDYRATFYTAEAMMEDGSRTPVPGTYSGTLTLIFEAVPPAKDMA